MPTPPEAMTASVGARRAPRARPSSVGARERAVAAMSVTTNAATPASANRAHDVEEPLARRLGPAPHRDLADRGVEADGDRLAAAAMRRDERRVLERRRCRSRPGPRPRRPAPRPPSSERTPPPVCTRHAGDRGGDGGDDRAVDGLAGAGGVEVDDVDPRARPRRRSRGRPRPGRRRTRSRGVVALVRAARTCPPRRSMAG